MNQMETGQDMAEFNAFSDKNIRRGFIRKVYGILSVQLLFTFVPCILFSYSVGAKQFAMKNWYILIVAMICNIVLIFPMACSRKLRTDFPLNFIILGLFTLSEAVMLSFVGATVNIEVMTIAIGITSIIVISLTLFAMQTKIDFTICNGLVFCVLLCLTLAGLSLTFYHGPGRPLINVVYCGIGSLIFSFIIVVDTQMIVGGGRQMEITPEEYIFAALVLYLDIIRLFLYILQIVAESKN